MDVTIRYSLFIQASSSRLGILSAIPLLSTFSRAMHVHIPLYLSLIHCINTTVDARNEELSSIMLIRSNHPITTSSAPLYSYISRLELQKATLSPSKYYTFVLEYLSTTDQVSVTITVDTVVFLRYYKKERCCRVMVLSLEFIIHVFCRIVVFWTLVRRRSVHTALTVYRTVQNGNVRGISVVTMISTVKVLVLHRVEVGVGHWYELERNQKISILKQKTIGYGDWTSTSHH